MAPNFRARDHATPPEMMKWLANQAMWFNATGPLCSSSSGAANYFRNMPKPPSGVPSGSAYIWNRITPTAGLRDGTHIPQSFMLQTSKDAIFFVNSNATKHMADHVIRKAAHCQVTNNLAQLKGFETQAMLSDFEASVSKAIGKGYQTDKLIKEGNWELIFGAARERGYKNVIYHAVYRPQ